MTSNNTSQNSGANNNGAGCQIGMIGLAVMGANLVRNLERNGYKCAVFNRTTTVTDEFMKENEGKNFVPSATLEEFVASLERPRKAIIMIQAGKAVDAVIDNLIALMDKGDIIIDAGNTHYKDTQKREEYCKSKGINFVGMGVSGGEEGALWGPSIMPGGPSESWEILKPFLTKISAKVKGKNGAEEPCVTHIGPDGAGHFVKMVHNGIEYGDMQLIAESYDILKQIGGLGAKDLHSVFAEWNEGILNSFLIEITAQIFKKIDPETGNYLVDMILDKGGQKGTGKWTIQLAADFAATVPTIAAAVDARNLSALKTERVKASKEFAKPDLRETTKEKDLVNLVRDALYSAKILSYAQGMYLLQKASIENKWDLKLNEIASIWRGGCIIRAKLLGEIEKAFLDNPGIPNLMLANSFKEELKRGVPALRKITALAITAGIPVPAFTSAISYFDLYTTERLPLNLTQAQRDLFGAHTYERTDREGICHSEW